MKAPKIFESEEAFELLQGDDYGHFILIDIKDAQAIFEKWYLKSAVEALPGSKIVSNDGITWVSDLKYDVPYQEINSTGICSAKLKEDE